MARAKKIKDEVDENGGVVKPIDAERAAKIIREDILPELSTVGDHSQRMSTAYKAIRKECNIPSWVVRQAIRLKDEEDFKRDHELRAFQAMLKAFGIGIIRADLADMAEGKGDTPVVPTAGRASIKLVTTSPPPRPVPEMSDGVDADLADGADDIDDGLDGHEADGDTVEDEFFDPAEAAE
jgi:hypothetical protein